MPQEARASAEGSIEKERWQIRRAIIVFLLWECMGRNRSLIKISFLSGQLSTASAEKSWAPVTQHIAKQKEGIKEYTRA